MVTEIASGTSINWRELIITEGDGYQQTLKEFVDFRWYADPTFFVEWDIHAPYEFFGFNNYFINAPGEPVSWDTPKCLVDWEGFYEYANPGMTE